MFTASPTPSLWRTTRYLSNIHGLSKRTLSRSFTSSNRNRTLLSPMSLTSKFFSVCYIDFNTLTTDSRLTLLFVQNLPANTSPVSVVGGVRSTSLSSIFDNCNLAHLFAISFMLYSIVDQSNYFLLSRRRDKFALRQALFFTSRFP